MIASQELALSGGQSAGAVLVLAAMIDAWNLPSVVLECFLGGDQC